MNKVFLPISISVHDNEYSLVIERDNKRVVFTSQRNLRIVNESDRKINSTERLLSIENLIFGIVSILMTTNLEYEIYLPLKECFHKGINYLSKFGEPDTILFKNYYESEYVTLSTKHRFIDIGIIEGTIDDLKEILSN